MTTGNEDSRMWTLTHTIMAGMGAIIIILLTAGFWSINTKIDTGDTFIGLRLSEMTAQLNSTNQKFQKLCEDVARIDTLQKIRLEKEIREKK